jgi:hypothetical protein
MTKQAEDDARGFVHLTHITWHHHTLQPICIYFMHCERLLHPLQNINVSSITMIIS